uniref:NR LBD domain-containing protein n=1 Tax=Timema tahoe TaxID=61484 RepID=A0A7R9FHR5_9NEOP|nr:unnamed protein product [Timema tahoe]
MGSFSLSLPFKVACWLGWKEKGKEKPRDRSHGYCARQAGIQYDDDLECLLLQMKLLQHSYEAPAALLFRHASATAKCSLLQVDDQMKLLQHSWSDMLVLDHLHQRMHNNLPDETTLPNGQKFDLLGLGLLGVPTLTSHFNELTAKLQELKFDVSDYICLKFLLLLNPGNYPQHGQQTQQTSRLGRCGVRMRGDTHVSSGSSTAALSGTIGNQLLSIVSSRDQGFWDRAQCGNVAPATACVFSGAPWFDVRGIMNRKHVQEGYEQVQQALLDYTVNCYPHIQDKFTKLLMVMPEIHQMASRGEDHLYHKHCDGSAPTQTLLMEMLHAKRK